MIDPTQLEIQRRALSMPEEERATLARCRRGHVLDGVKWAGDRGSSRRFCRTCQAERATEADKRKRPTQGPCLRCGEAELSCQNQCGMCLPCWNAVGPITRAFYRERFNTKKGRAA